MKENEAEALAGAGLAVASDLIWSSWPSHEAFKKSLMMVTTLVEGEPTKSPLAFVEHYHFGLASLLLARQLGSAFLKGLGLYLIASEALQKQPFGVGKSDWEVGGNLLLTGLLGMMF